MALAGLRILQRASAAPFMGAALLLACGLLTSHLQPARAQSMAAPAVKAKPEAPVTEQGPRWQSLRPAQKVSLEPLESNWSSLDADQKLKWIEVAQRMPGMPPDEQARIQLRMSEWVMLRPIERGRVRFNFQEAQQQLTPEQRRAQWKAYQALPEEEKRQLADARRSSQSGKARASASDGKPASRIPVSARAGGGNVAAAGPAKKSNITPNPAFAQPPTPVAPTLVHPSYGATTTLVSKTPTPPAHQQVGLPKIVASPRFIDPKTLLPRRGPQAAAAFTTAASDTPLERP